MTARRVPALLLMALLCSSHSGCLTKRTYQRFEASTIESGWIELIDADPASVRLKVSIEYEGALRRKGKIEFDPRLEDCDHPQILLQSDHADVALVAGERHVLVIDRVEGAVPDREVIERAAERGTSAPSGACTVLIHTSIYSDDISVDAANFEGNLGGVLIRSPKNVWALALLLPAAATVDVVGLAPLIIVECFRGPEQAAGCIAVGAMVLGEIFQNGG